MVGCYELQIQLSVFKSEQYEPETVIRLRNGNESVRKYSLVKTKHSLKNVSYQESSSKSTLSQLLHSEI